MTRAALAALLAHWRAQPLLLVTLVAGLALAAAAWTGVQALNAEARAAYAQAAAEAARAQRWARPDGGQFDQAAFLALRRAGWAASPVLEGRLGGVDVIGVDPVSAPGSGGGDGEPGALLRFITPPGLGTARPRTLARLDRAAFGDLALEPSDAAPPGAVVVDIGVAQRLLNAPGMLSALLVDAQAPPGSTPIEALTPDLAPALEPQADLGRLTESFHLNLAAFALLSFAVGLFIAHAAAGLAVEQRRPLARILRALGLSARRLAALVLAELAALALVAGLIGAGLGWLVARALTPAVADTLASLYDAAIADEPALRWSWILSGLGLTLLGALLAGAQGVRRLAVADLPAAPRPAAWAEAAARIRRLQLAGAASLTLAALALGLWGKGLIAGFSLLGAGLGAAALATPLLLDAALRLCAARAPEGRAAWFFADARQQLPGLSLALMALMLALAANLGVSTMVGSFRTTFEDWLDQRLAAELYIRARDETEADRLRAFLAPRADAVLPIIRIDAALAGAPGALYGVRDHATYRDHWPLIAAAPDAWTRVAAGGAALVNEQLWRRAGLDLGDMLGLPGGALPIAGVYADYGNPDPQAMIGLPLFDARFPRAPRLRYALRSDAPDALRAALLDEFGLSPGQIADQTAIKTEARAVFERTFAVTAALNALTLGVAAVALFTGLLTLARMRRAALAPVWALGETRARLAALDLARAALMALLAALIALPTGIGLAWALLKVVNVAAFGWLLPMRLAPTDIAVLLLTALAAALIAAALPAWRLWRIPPARLLAVFAHDR